MLPDSLRRLGATWLVLSVLAAAGRLPATWSIILVDTRTKEIAIGSATCISMFDLRAALPVVVVGRGAAAAQSYVDVSGRNRALIFAELVKGTSPARILTLLARQDPSHRTRQYGIVDVAGRAVSFTGSWAGAWAGQVTGRIGTIAYAIQGNVLTGAPVIAAAEKAVRTTKGDLASRLMAAMEAARAKGGDGRCSCSVTNPPGCGSPPRNFRQSARIGFVIVARQGDRDGTCNARVGCASGSYYLNLNVADGTIYSPDPVVTLTRRYLAWRKRMSGRPDHHLTTVALPATLPADGRTTVRARVVLRDLDGVRISRGVPRFTISLDATSTAGVTVGAVRSLGNGEFSFPVTAGTKEGVARLRIVVDDGKGPVLLSPRTQVELRRRSLWADVAERSTRAGGRIAFVLNAGARRAHRPYLLLASASGSRPGIRLPGGLVLPLNDDPILMATCQAAVAGTLPTFAGRLDTAGRAEARLDVPAGPWGFLAGATLTFAYGTLAPIDFVSGAVAVRFVP